jgi:hypothetical protein
MAALKNCSEGENCNLQRDGVPHERRRRPPSSFGTLRSASLEVLDDDRPLVPPMIQIIAFMLFALLLRNTRSNTMGRVPLETIIPESSNWLRTMGRGPGQRPIVSVGQSGPTRSQ